MSILALINTHRSVFISDSLSKRDLIKRRRETKNKSRSYEYNVVNFKQLNYVTNCLCSVIPYILYKRYLLHMQSYIEFIPSLHIPHTLAQLVDCGIYDFPLIILTASLMRVLRQAHSLFPSTHLTYRSYRI